MKVLCVGNCAYDITTMLDEFPRENKKYHVNEQFECCGGSASNAAYLLAKWGLNVYFAGMVGNDIYGKYIIDDFKSIGVNISYLQVSNIYKTVVSYILINKQNGSRTILSHKDNNRFMSNINLDFNPDIIFLDGHEYKMSKKIIEKNPNALIIIDAGHDNDQVKKLCKMANYVVCSKDFMESVSGIIFSNEQDLLKAFEILEGLFMTKIIVTLEEKGCAYRDKSCKVVIIPTFKVKVIDTTGAGDIFHGAFIYGLVKKWSMNKILKFANTASTLSVTKIGGRNSIVSLKEVEEVYNEIK